MFSGFLFIRNFYGCLKSLYFDFIDIFYGVKMDENNYDIYGLVCFYCLDISYVLVNFLEFDIYLKFSKYFFENFFVEFSFCIYDGDGVLVYKWSVWVCLYFFLVLGKFEIEVWVKFDKLIKFSVGEVLNDGMWYDVIVGVICKDMWL